MNNDAITVGSKTTTGGVVISGNSGVLINNQPIALVGDIATCTCGSKSCRGKGPIMATGPRDIVINGRSFAKAGDPVDTGCGNCYLAISSNLVILEASLTSTIKKANWDSIANSMSNNSGAMESTSVDWAPPYIFPDNAKPTQEAFKFSELDAGEWLPVEGNFPLLVYETQKKMDDFSAPDMTFGDENKESIERYGVMKPFRRSRILENYSSDSYRDPPELIDVSIEDQFSLPASEHFRRMRSLANDVIFGLGFSIEGKTKRVFFEMVDKFERNEGGYYSNPLLTHALKEHETTATFHKTLKNFLGKSLKNGKLPNNIVSLTSQYMRSDDGVTLPMFNPGLRSDDLTNGTIITVHGIWSMRVYIEQLEYKGNQIRGIFRYEVQDHFGLDPDDINHKLIVDDPLKHFEQLAGFRSWYILQHYPKYGFKPFITEMIFLL